MKILILGAGRMGAWLAETLRPDHEVAVYDPDRQKLKRCLNVTRFPGPSEAKEFEPALVINAADIAHVREAFETVLPHLPKTCILSDITSVKTGIRDLYKALGRRFVSTHPMFGPTFANIRHPRDENAIIIQESDPEGKAFFRDFYGGLHVNVHEYTFEKHDQTIAYSLSIPFASSMVFAAAMKQQEAPGTTFRRHLDIARGLLSEDDQLLSEIMFNPYTVKQIEVISSSLAYLTHIIRARDYEEMQKFLNRLRCHIC
ncbi:MAG: prephenate dehydratase [Desulfococcus sp. 4484_242]|nr:MAG: prephenate dehydratase [Desulfococcus sp. 4484_242]